MLTAGVLVDGVHESVVAGVPQGGVATAPTQLRTSSSTARFGVV
jgi:hypothetical protein